MKILSISLILLGFFQQSFGQISGKLTTATGQSVPFANVILVTSTDSSLVKAALTDENGLFLIQPVPAGAYKLRVSSLGYQTWNSPIFELTDSQPVKNFGTQLLQEDAKQLSEVVIRAEKPLIQQITEGTVVNVENSLLSKGSSALQILERSPGVVLDYRNGGFSLNGKSGAMVMLNGKLMRMPLEQVAALLNGMSANDIEKIELLTTPGARYDADGSAGLINIVLKKNTKAGTNGSFSLTGGYGWGEKGTASLNLAHITKRVSLYGSYSYLHNRTYSNMFVLSSQNMPVLGGNIDVTAWDTTHAIQNNHDATAGIDLFLNPKTTLGGTVTWSSNVRSSTDFDRWNGRIISPVNNTIRPDSLLLFQGMIDGRNRWQNLASSLYAERKISDGEKLTGSLDYFHYTNYNPSEVKSTFRTENGTQAGHNDTLFAPRQRGFASTAIRVGVAKLDYSKQLSPKFKLEAGVKGTYTRNVSGAGIESLLGDTWVSRAETADELIMREGIGAAYASVNGQLTPSANLIIGLRYEHSRTVMDNPRTSETIVDRRLGVFFPSIFFTKKLSENAELQMSYTKRISRPSYNDLASFIRYSDPSAVYTGNPYLRPTITNNIKLGYSYRNYAFSLLLSRDDYPIARNQLSEGPARNLLYILPQNLSWQNSINLQINLPWRVTNWWEMTYGFTGGLRQFKADYPPQPVQETYFGYSLNMSQSFKLPRQFSAELSGWYNSISFNGTTKVGGMGALNAGVKKELKSNGGSLQLSVTDLLQTVRINVHYGTITQEAFSIKSHVYINTESRLFPILKLTYTRSFGKTSSTQQRQSGAGDEKERIKSN
jgi:outer membrane receptor protein involved in Fe transport